MVLLLELLLQTKRYYKYHNVTIALLQGITTDCNSAQRTDGHSSESD